MQRHPIALYVVAVALAVLAAMAFVDRGVTTRLDTESKNFTGGVDTLWSQADETGSMAPAPRHNDPRVDRAGSVASDGI